MGVYIQRPANNTAYVKKDGTTPLTGDWDIGEDRRLKTEAIRARDGEGVWIEDDAGNVIADFLDGGNNVVFCAASFEEPYSGFIAQVNRAVFIRQATATSAGTPIPTLIMSNNQTNITNGNIGSISWMNEAESGTNKRNAQILVQTDGDENSGKMYLRTYAAGVAQDTVVLDAAKRVIVDQIIRAATASGLRLEDDGGNPGVIVNDSGTLTLSTIAANWDAGAFSILANGFQARASNALNLRSHDGLTRWQINTDGDLIGYVDIGGGSVNDHFYQVMRQPASVTRLQTITIELVSVAAVLVWNTYFDIGLARNGNTAVFGWATGRVTWQNQNSALAANILSYDIASDSSGTTTVTVTAITNGISIAFGGGDFLNTLDRNSVIVRTFGYDAIRPAVTITIA